MQNTTNYNLNKPDGNDFAKIASLNENADIIDSKLKELEDSESAFVQHSNNQQIHVTQAKQNSWDAKVNRSGDTLTGDFVIEKGIPKITLKPTMTPSDDNKKLEVMYNATGSNDFGVAIKKDGADMLYMLGQKDIRFLDHDDVWTSLADLKSSVSNGKTAIADAITQKGVATSAAAEFATMATNILSINTGKKFATGVGAGATTMYSFRRAFNNETVSSYGLTVSGLDFKPGLILAFDAVSISMYQNYLSLDSAQTGGVVTDFTTITAFGGGTQTAVNTMSGTGGDGYVNNGGFRIPIRSNTITVNWIAIE